MLGFRSLTTDAAEKLQAHDPPADWTLEFDSEEKWCTNSETSVVSAIHCLSQSLHVASLIHCLDEALLLRSLRFFYAPA